MHNETIIHLHIISGFYFYYFFTFCFHYLYNKDLDTFFSIFFIRKNIANFFILIIAIFYNFYFFIYLLLSFILITYLLHQKIHINFKETSSLSPDYYFASKFKNIYKEPLVKQLNLKLKIFNKNLEKANAITFWNNFNIYISILFFLSTIFIYFKRNEFLENFYYSIFLAPFFGFLCYRTFSRCLELIYAFYNDITDSKIKNNHLNSNKRIMLATKSYFEIIFNFATLNTIACFFSNSFYYSYLFETINKEQCHNTITYSDPFNHFIKSFGITTFTNASVNSIFGSLQILTTLVLVLFALAGYLNNKGDNN